MNLETLEKSVRDIVTNLDQGEFIFQLLRAYEQPKASITRLKNGEYNQSKNEGEVLWKKKLCFRHESEVDLHECIDRLKSEKSVTKHAPHFIVVTDFENFIALDTKNEDTLDIPLDRLPSNVDFFLPWANMEKSQIRSGAEADRRAAEKMGQLYELIAIENAVESKQQRHALNIFLSRLLFCFFAEDTEIFKPDQFTNAIASHTAEDGSDLQGYLQKLFAVLATEDREAFPEFLQKFPYVNGGLFCEDYPVPSFDRKSRQIIVDCGSLDWKAINPDIFGTMIQAVTDPDERRDFGKSYTSVPNIMKVIEPLFLNELKKELEEAGVSKKKLDGLLNRLYNLRIFDPACGSGNFLIIAYKELCRLEIEAFRRLGRSKNGVQMNLFRSNLQLTQFYGIELDDFAHETARLSLWLAEHQMNLEFKSVFGATRPTLPLQEGGNIVCDNATRLDWNQVCPRDDGGETYVLGNPPYVGARNQSKNQKHDMELVFEGHKDFKDSDYVCCWVIKGASYINGVNAKLAFVSTNSICQGEQVGFLWPRVLQKSELGFAYRSFEWSNNAKDKAGVTCVIVGLRNLADDEKVIFDNGTEQVVKNISPYLIDYKNTIVFGEKEPPDGIPKVVMGNMARDGGFLILSKSEYAELTAEHPESSQFLRRLYGASEFLRGKERWCLWIEDDDLQMAKTIPPIRDRIESVLKKRNASKAKTTRQYSSIPHKFAQRSFKPGTKIIVPKVSTDRREYVPVGFLTEDSIISDLAFVIYEADISVFALISSKMHVAWINYIGGKFRTGYRYSARICYNPFPFPKMSKSKKASIESLSLEILDARENHPEKTLEDLYEPDTFPRDLHEAHQKLDEAVDRLYRTKAFSDNEERVKFLLGLYEEKNRGKRA